MNYKFNVREDGRFILVVEEDSSVLTISDHRNHREVHLFDEEIIKLRDFLNSEVKEL